MEVGSYQAKTRLPELLRGVQAGNRPTITVRGAAVAELVPTQIGQRAAAEAVDGLLAYMKSRRSATGSVDLKALMEEGRE